MPTTPAPADAKTRPQPQPLIRQVGWSLRTPRAPRGVSSRVGFGMPWLAGTDVGAARVRPGARRSPDGRRVTPGAAGARRARPRRRADMGPRRARNRRRPPRGRPLRGRAARRLRDNRWRVAGHPLLLAHAARGRPPLRLSEAIDRRRLSRSELYGDLLHRSGVEYSIAIGVRAGRREVGLSPGSAAPSVRSPSAPVTSSISCAPA
jgi:hypothetical protein